MLDTEPSDPGWAPAADLLVTDPAAVEVLWQADKRRHLKPFLGRAADLATAAAELGIAKPAMSYWIGRLLDVGLIRLVGTHKQGRHVRRSYRCVADRLRVALVEAPLSSYEGVFADFSTRWMGQAHDAMSRSLARQASQLELSIADTGAAGLSTTILPRQGCTAPPDDFLYYWARLWLAPEQAQALAREMDALYERYGALSDREAPGAVPTLVHLLHVRETR